MEAILGLLVRYDLDAVAFGLVAGGVFALLLWRNGKRKPAGVEMPLWRPKRPPIWLTDWRRPRRAPLPRGGFTSEQAQELFRRRREIASLATVRTGSLENS